MICKNCGSEIDDKAVLCVHCGKKIKQKNIKALLIPFVILVAIMAFFVFCVIVSTSSFNNDMSNAAEYISSGEFDKAKEILNEQLDKNSGQEQVYVVFSDYYVAQNRYLKATEILEEGLNNCVSVDEIEAKLNYIKSKYSKEIEKEKVEPYTQVEEKTQKKEEPTIEENLEEKQVRARKKKDAEKLGISVKALDNMLNACETVGIEYADISNLSPQEDWAFGKRCSWYYKRCHFLVYFNQDETVNSINMGIGREKVYENGQKVKDIDDYIAY